jgi:hypothetical protein
MVEARIRSWRKSVATALLSASAILGSQSAAQAQMPAATNPMAPLSSLTPSSPMAPSNPMTPMKLPGMNGGTEIRSTTPDWSNGGVPSRLQEPTNGNGPLSTVVDQLSSKPQEEKKNPFSAQVLIQQDSFFGFNPTLSGSYNINDTFAFTFYGVLWTTPSFTPNGRGGTG